MQTKFKKMFRGRLALDYVKFVVNESLVAAICCKNDEQNVIELLYV